MLVFNFFTANDDFRCNEFVRLISRLSRSRRMFEVVGHNHRCGGSRCLLQWSKEKQKMARRMIALCSRSFVSNNRSGPEKKRERARWEARASDLNRKWSGPRRTHNKPKSRSEGMRRESASEGDLGDDKQKTMLNLFRALCLVCVCACWSEPLDCYRFCAIKWTGNR